jgi:hypothetical protein
LAAAVGACVQAAMSICEVALALIFGILGYNLARRALPATTSSIPNSPSRASSMKLGDLPSAANAAAASSAARPPPSSSTPAPTPPTPPFQVDSEEYNLLKRMVLAAESQQTYNFVDLAFKRQMLIIEQRRLALQEEWLNIKRQR